MVRRVDPVNPLSHRSKEAGSSPIETLRLFAQMRASEALKARAMAIRDELTDMVTIALAKTADRHQRRHAANLAVSLLVAICEVAFLEAHRIFHQGRDIEEATRGRQFLKQRQRHALGTERHTQRNTALIHALQSIKVIVMNKVVPEIQGDVFLQRVTVGSAEIGAGVGVRNSVGNACKTEIRPAEAEIRKPVRKRKGKRNELIF